MAYYRILETPGRKEVDIKEELDEDVKINNQDVAKILVQKLRAKAKKEGRKIDYVVVTDREKANGNVGSSVGGTSIRLSEEQRKRLAKIVGKHMYETGETISMGDALVRIIEENEMLHRTIEKLQAEDED